MLPGQQRSTGRGTDRITYKSAPEEHAFFGQPVDIRRGYELSVVGADRVIIMVVTHDINNIGPLLCGGHEATQERTEEETAFWHAVKLHIKSRFVAQSKRMEFGRVPDIVLDQVDFSLIPDPPGNKRVLPGSAARDPKIYIGCAKWGREEWVGKIYPPKTRERHFLKHYLQHFNSIELNATHYRIIGEKGTRRWALEAADRDFKFCPKMYQGITHKGNLKGKKFLVSEFLRGIAGFGQHLGPVFVQVNERFSPKRKQELFDFLAALPGELQFFLEVRHPNWFSAGREMDELFAFLREHKIGAVITDTAGRRDAAHMRLSIPKTFIRYAGNSLHSSDYARIDAWVERVKYWLDNGLEELYFFMHMHDEALSPELTAYLVDTMNKRCGLNLLKPAFIEPGAAAKPPA